MSEYYEIRHIVGFEETNLVGNVYYANYVRWQGRAREIFLRDHAPGVVQEIRDGLKLFTVAVGCEYLAELTALDEISIRLRLLELRQTQVRMGFEYVQHLDDTRQRLVATGFQHIAFMREIGGDAHPVAVPTELARALDRFRPARATA